MSLKSILTRIISKKLLDTRLEGVFIRYYNKTDKQFTIYYLDLRYVISLLVINIDKTKQGGSINLKIRGENA